MPKKSNPKLPSGIFERPVGSGIYWIRYYDDKGHSRIEKVGPSIREAQQLREARLTDLRRGEFDAAMRRKKRLRFGDFLDDYLEDVLPVTRDLQNVRKHARLWRDMFGNHELDEIEPQAFERWRTRRLREGAAPATVNRALSFLKRVLNVAVQRGKLRAHPLASVRKLKENNERVRYLASEEEAWLKVTLAARFWPLVQLAIGTGLRLSERMNLLWSNIDFVAGVITVPRSKHGEARRVPIRPEVESILRRLPSRMKSPWVFPNQKGTGPVGRYGTLRDAFPAALKAVGIEDFHWHDLRHTTASRLVMADVPLNTVREIMGHKTILMTQRYAHLAPDHLRDAIAAFPMEDPEAACATNCATEDPLDGQDADNQARTGA